MSPSPGTPPPAEVAIDGGLVERLLADQHADLRKLDVRFAAEGWDNVTFRLGSEWAVRLPRRAAAANLIRHEQRWLPYLAPSLSLPIPAPIRCGRPASDFPWHWSVVPWVGGTSALNAPLHGTEARRLGTFLGELHTIEIPSNPPHNPYRGGALADRRQVDYERLQRLARSGVAGPLIPALDELLAAGAATPNDAPITWLHGDLHSKNVVSNEGTIASIIDWGDICTGDPATDLATVWRLFPNSSHSHFWAAYGDTTEATVRRSAGWAVAHGLMIWDSHHGAEPIFAAAALEALGRVTAF